MSQIKWKNMTNKSINGDFIWLLTLDELRSKAPSFWGMDVVGAAGEDDCGPIQISNGFNWGCAIDAKGEDVEDADSAGGEMGVLR